MTTFLLILFCLTVAIYMQVHFGKIIYQRGVKAGKSMAHAETIKAVGIARQEGVMSERRCQKSREMQSGSLPMDPMDVSEAIHRARL